jgi:hypothetical protein
MKLSYSIVSGAVMLVLVSACSKTESTSDNTPLGSKIVPAAPVAIHNPPALLVFKDLERFKGKPPMDLVNDDLVGKAIRAVVPQSQFKCMDKVFDNIQDLYMETDGSVTSLGEGSHADNWEKSYISIKPNGAVNVVLQCGPKEMFQFFTNESSSATPSKSILDWMYKVGSEGDMITKSDGKERVEVSYAIFVQSYLAGAAKNIPTAMAASPSPTIPPVPSSAVISPPPSSTVSFLEGTWICQSRKANGTSFTSAFRFSPDGAFSYSDLESSMKGRYQLNGANAHVVMQQFTINAGTFASSTKVDIAYISSSPGQLKFDMKLVTLNTIVSNSCVTQAIAVAAPAPQVNICDVNPAACGAIQRNNDIRGQLQNQRCEILRQQLSGVFGGDYQLSKAGCS